MTAGGVRKCIVTAYYEHSNIMYYTSLRRNRDRVFASTQVIILESRTQTSLSQIIRDRQPWTRRTLPKRGGRVLPAAANHPPPQQSQPRFPISEIRILYLILPRHRISSQLPRLKFKFSTAHSKYEIPLQFQTDELETELKPPQCRPTSKEK